MVEDVKMSLLEHLDELRRRLVWAAAAFGIATMICFGYAYPFMKLVLRGPLDALAEKTDNPLAKCNYVVKRIAPHLAGDAAVPDTRFHATNVMEPFMVRLKLSLLAGLIVSAPVIFYQFWAFIGAGLLRRERRVVLTYLPVSLLLFAAGVAFAYIAVVPVMFLYLLTMDTTIETFIMIGPYVGLLVVTVGAFGLAFQLPLVLMALVRLGILSVKTLSHSRRYAIVLIFVIAAVITPSPEPFSQCLLAIPMVLLYEVGLLLARLSERKRLAGERTTE